MKILSNQEVALKTNNILEFQRLISGNSLFSEYELKTQLKFKEPVQVIFFLIFMPGECTYMRTSAGMVRNAFGCHYVLAAMHKGSDHTLFKLIHPI